MAPFCHSETDSVGRRIHKGQIQEMDASLHFITFSMTESDVILNEVKNPYVFFL